jgi:hypothetical protein
MYLTFVPTDTGAYPYMKTEQKKIRNCVGHSFSL